MDEHPYTRALRLASGSLSSVDYLPIMTHFCFQEGLVHAFDGMTATLVELETSLDCAVRGDVMMAMLTQASPKTKITKVDGLVHIKQGRSLVKLASMDDSHYAFQAPDEDAKLTTRVDKTFFDSLQLAEETCLADAFKPALSGVTMRVSDDIVLQAYDFASMVTFTLPKKKAKGSGQVVNILSKQCATRASKLFSDLGGGELEVILHMGKKWVKFEYVGTGVTLLSRIIDADPIDFSKDAEAFPLTVDPFPVPPTLLGTLEKCVALLGNNLGGYIYMVLSEEGLVIECSSDYGTLAVPIKLPPMPARKIKFSPKPLLKYLPKAESMSFTTNKNAHALHLMNDHMHYTLGRYPEGVVGQ